MLNLLLMFLLYLLNQVKIMKQLEAVYVTLVKGTKATIRNGKLFVIANINLPTVNKEARNTAFLDKKQFMAALLRHNGAVKFVNDKLVEELDIKVGDGYVAKKVYNDYAVAYAASHCSFVLQPIVCETGDQYEKSDGTLGVIETSYVRFDILSVEPNKSMTAALNKYAAAERDFFGF